MDEMYILHELHELNPPDDEEAGKDGFEETNNETEPEADPPPELPQPLVFEPIEEPGPNWEMELAQAYVRAQPLDGIFSPEEGLLAGTAFPNLLKPYTGRD